MKAQYTEDYYRANWDRFIKEVPGEHYINLEQDLENSLSIYKDVELLADALEILRKTEAKKIVQKCKELVYKEMALLKNLDAGKASLGYTTEIQEIRARTELRQRFEFNCYQLAQFKKKYDLEG